MDFLVQLISLTGLPKETVEKELFYMATERGFDPQKLTPENIKEIIAYYMQDALVELKKNIET